MASPTPPEVRERLIAAYQAGKGTQEELADIFGVARNTLSRIWVLYRSSGSLTPRNGKRGRRPKLDLAALALLLRLSADYPEATDTELSALLIDHGGPKASPRTINRLMNAQGRVRKPRRDKRAADAVLREDASNPRSATLSKDSLTPRPAMPSKDTPTPRPAMPSKDSLTPRPAMPYPNASNPRTATPSKDASSPHPKTLSKDALTLRAATPAKDASIPRPGMPSKASAEKTPPKDAAKPRAGTPSTLSADKTTPPTHAADKAAPKAANPETSAKKAQSPLLLAPPPGRVRAAPIDESTKGIPRLGAKSAGAKATTSATSAPTLSRLAPAADPTPKGAPAKDKAADNPALGAVLLAPRAASEEERGTQKGRSAEESADAHAAPPSENGTSAAEDSARKPRRSVLFKPRRS
jgi:transposase